MDIPASEQRRAFSVWLRTGRLPTGQTASGIQLKFNPYHDPRNGRFTFAPGGPRSLSRVITSDRTRPARLVERHTSSPTAFSSFLRGTLRAGSFEPNEAPANLLNDGVFRPSGAQLLQRTQYRPVPRGSIGSNSRAFQDPMTLEQTFPGLRESPGGSIIALAENIFDFSGPARETTTELSLQHSKVLIERIKVVDPGYQLQSFGLPATLDGQMSQIADLRLDLATAFYRKRGEMRPLQVETLRFIQKNTDRAYDVGRRLYEEGKLNVRLSREEAIGNHVDRSVRRELRNLYGRLGISTARDQQVRVNSREYDTSGTDSTYRLPDARVGRVVFDWTLTRKTAGTAQVRGYFNADLKPDTVIIVRPSQLGPQSTYAISRPRN
jgi:hypothetical protein